MLRRNFLKTLALSTPAILWSSQLAKGMPSNGKSAAAKALSADLIVAGGGMGGCAAALAAARNGLRVVMTEETDWIGGQLTSQAVPPDEHYRIETLGCTASYRELRNRIRDYYRRNYPLTDAARATANLNPGAGGVSRICHEPRVALAVLYEMLAPYLANGSLQILLNHKIVAADSDGDRIRSITAADVNSGDRISLEAPWFIDATELGDVLPLSKTEFVMGAESQKQTGEMHAPEKADPDNHQAITWCFPMEHVNGANFVEDPPPNYNFWKNYVPEMSPPWPGPLLSFTYSHPRTLEPRTLDFDPENDTGAWWRYRRIAYKNNFVEGAYAGSITLVNWPQNDYLLGHIIGTEEENKKHLAGARELSLALFYWMQTDAPRPDGGTGFPGLRLRPEIVGTLDGLAKYPYIRESRRIRAEFTVLEQHVGALARREALGEEKGARAETFHDTVGIGSYAIDLHPSTRGRNYVDVPSLPFQIPLGSLIPVRTENLLAGAKNLGVTHITNGCYRLHPVEWNIGESAGALIAFCKSKNATPRQTRNTENLLRDFQSMLEKQGVELAWPEA